MATLWLRCRHLVIDPCNRMPGHLPRSDGWLNSQNDRLAQTVCDRPSLGWVARGGLRRFVRLHSD